jgi:hypothetical protein
VCADKFFSFLDKEEESQIVEHNLDQFRSMYHQVWQDNFRDVMELTDDGKFKIDASDDASRRLLSMHLNDNVLYNMKKVSVLLFDEKERFKKSEFSGEERSEKVDSLMKSNELKKTLDTSVDRILLAHRNTAIFLFMMTGPFLLLLQTLKYASRFAVLFWLYTRAKSNKTSDDGE